MNIKVEFKYAVLYSLLMLLWLCIEYITGFQDKYISWYPYVNLGSFIIPVICIRLALIDKNDLLFQKMNFIQAFVCGLKVTALATVFSFPVQLLFLKELNPDFLNNMIAYYILNGRPKEMAQMFFSPGFHITESAVITFISGLIVSLILARLMRTLN